MRQYTVSSSFGRSTVCKTDSVQTIIDNAVTYVESFIGTAFPPVVTIDDDQDNRVATIKLQNTPFNGMVAVARWY